MSAAPVLKIPRLMQNEHLRARGFWETITHADAGSLFFILSVGYFITLMGSGFVSARITHRWTMVLSIACTGLALLATAASESLWQLRAGLFLTAVVRDIQKGGGRVPAVLDETSFLQRVPPPGLLARQFAKFAQGGAMLARLPLAGTDVRNGTRILEARGDDSLREMVVVRVDKKGNVIPGSESVSSALKPFAAVAMASGWGEVFIARTGYTGEDGFEVFAPPAQAERIWNAPWPEWPGCQAVTMAADRTGATLVDRLPQSRSDRRALMHGLMRTICQLLVNMIQEFWMPLTLR